MIKEVNEQVKELSNEDLGKMFQDGLCKYFDIMQKAITESQKSANEVLLAFNEIQDRNKQVEEA